MKRAVILALSCILLTTNACKQAVNTPRKFVSGSMSTILREHAGKPMLVNFWSISCPPCREEMPVLARFMRENPQVDIVTIATDDIAEQDAVVDALHSSTLATADNWIFAEEFAEALRYEVDPTWYGEMPRTYLYASDGRRETIAGKVTPNTLQTWLASTNRR